MIDQYISAAVTLFVGSFAIFLYIKGRRDKKRDAASIILQEIKSAERKIKEAKDKSTDSIDWSDELPILSSKSWGKYKYLFINNFDADEWDAVNDFYEKCSLYDNSIMGGVAAFSKNEEQIRINAHRIFADYINEVIEKVVDNSQMTPDELKTAYETVKQKASLFSETYLNSDDDFVKPMYTPQKYMNDRNRLLNLIDTNLSKNSVGNKLKNIAKVKP